jgi:hypothetical protein
MEMTVFFGDRDVAWDCDDGMRSTFDYVEKASRSFGGVPRVILGMTASVEVGGAVITPVQVKPGTETMYGFRIDADGKSLTYIPDCSGLPPESFQCLEKLDVMSSDGLGPGKHSPFFRSKNAWRIF